MKNGKPTVTNPAYSEPLSYREAVDIAKRMLEGCLKFKLSSQAMDDYVTQQVAPQMLQNRPDLLLALAAKHHFAFDALRFGVADAIANQSDQDLPPDVRTWLVSFLRGEVERPKAGAGRRGGGNDLWHLHIAITVFGLVKAHGMTATRNDASEQTSACDAVADALAKLDEEPTTFHSVKRIWLRFLRTRKEAPELAGTFGLDENPSALFD
jgi:hypothetical protein